MLEAADSPALTAPSGSPCARPGCPNLFSPRHPRHLYCCDRCRYQAADARRSKDRAHITENRARFARWRTANGHAVGNQPALLGAPPHGVYLGSVGTSLTLSPVPAHPVLLRNAWQLHGALHHLLGEPHDRNRPSFSLVPWNEGLGWGVLWHTARGHELAERRDHRLHLFGQDRALHLGPAVRLKCPTVTRRGWRLLRIDVVTPVVIRCQTEGNSTTTRTCPEASNLIGALTGEFSSRLGLTQDPAQVCVELMERHTQPETTLMGGKYPPVRGFVGHLTVRTNAVGHWLLLCAERLGLGGRTGFGFGRVRVTEVVE